MLLLKCHAILWYLLGFISPIILLVIVISLWGSSLMRSTIEAIVDGISRIFLGR